MKYVAYAAVMLFAMGTLLLAGCGNKEDATSSATNASPAPAPSLAPGETGPKPAAMDTAPQLQPIK